MSSKNNGSAQSRGTGGNNSSGGGQGNTGKSSQRAGQRTTSGWQADNERAYADAANGIDNDETWGYGGGSTRFGEGYMRGHQEIYGDKGPDF